MITILIAVVAAVLTVIMRQYKMGPWNKDMQDFTDLPYMPYRPTKVMDPDSFVPSPTVTPSPAPTVPAVPNTPSLTDFCLAIRDFEGKPGDQNYRLNNPGNARYNPSGYLPIYGNVGCSKNGFAIFPTPELGMLYLHNLIKSIIHMCPDLTLLTFIGGNGHGWAGYSPASDGNPVTEYAQFLANRLGVDSNWQIKNLSYT